jgi:acyl carrier protein
VAIVDDLRDFLGKDLRVADAATLTEDFPLVQRGVLDSIELMQVVEFLERTYGIQIDDTDIVPANLGTLAAMSALVSRKQNATAAR